MGSEESKKDLLLKRTQVVVAIVAGLATAAVGFYNVKKTYFADNTPGQVAIMVRSDKGAALNGAHLELFDAQNTLVTAGTADGQGVYAKQGLMSGSYILKVKRSGFEPETQTLRVDAKKTTDVEIVLRPVAASAATSSPIRSALEEAGASWIKNLGQPKSESTDASKTQ